MVVLRLTFDDGLGWTCPMSREFAESWCWDLAFGAMWRGEHVRRVVIVSLEAD